MASYVQLGQSGKVYKDPPPTGGKPPRKKKHKQNQQFAYILIALVLVLGIGAMAGTMIWLTSSNPNEPESLEDVDVATLCLLESMKLGERMKQRLAEVSTLIDTSNSLF